MIFDVFDFPLAAFVLFHDLNLLRQVTMQSYSRQIVNALLLISLRKQKTQTLKNTGRRRAQIHKTRLTAFQRFSALIRELPGR